MNKKNISVSLILIFVIGILSGNCYTLRISDREVNTPEHQAKFFLNNPHNKSGNKFSHSYREYYLWWGIFHLGHFPSIENPIASPFEYYLKDIHTIEKAKEYVNVEVETSMGFIDIGITGVGIILFGLWPSARTVEITGEAVK
jgi:hypothetical protein